jgi:hypothetical protein
MNHEINTDDLNAYFKDPEYAPGEKQLLSDGFLEKKVYHGIVIERTAIMTKAPDKLTGEKMPMLLYKINFKVEGDREKTFTHTIVFYPKDHNYHNITMDSTDNFKKATGVDAENAFASESAFIGKEVDATLKKSGRFVNIKFVNKGVVDDMKEAGQNVPDGKAESFDDDIPF